MDRNLSAWFMAGVVSAAGFAPTAMGNLLTVGAGGGYSNISDAWSAAGAGDTIQFIDSAAYTSDTLFLSGKTGLTVESAPGQRATINFSSAAIGFYLNANDVTFRNLNLNTTGFNSIITADGPPVGSNTTITDVSFGRTVQLPNYSLSSLVQSAEGMHISYSTFRGSGASPIGLGVGLGWSIGTTVTVNHSSFDNFMIPINQGSSSGTTALTITNSALGIWYNAGWAGGISLGDSGPALTEDYNASYGPSSFIYNPAGATVNSGGHSIRVNAYNNIFAGSTGDGNWAVDAALYHAASDGTAIGAWQPAPVPEPASAALIVLGTLALTARRRR